MNQQITAPTTGIKSLSSFLNGDAIKAKFTEILGSRGTSFVASVLSLCNTNKDLKNATPESIYTAALMAATLDLPINQNLGFAFLIPYKTQAGTPNEKVECQFQISAKGFKQLAIRTGQYLRISDAIVYEGQLVKEDPLTGFEFDFTKKGEKVIGYVSYFKLITGYESTFYMTKEQVTAHALRYSQTFRSKVAWVRDQSKWSTDFDAMALKTVTKLNLSKNGPLSVEMQNAMVTDQSVIKDTDTLEVSYEDNVSDPMPEIDKEEERMVLLINSASSLEELKALKKHVPDKLLDLYNETEIKLKEKK
ncbi:MAG: recombinase RecT [Pseudomonadota bacterium]|jgi:recombination protein RecT